jgi:TetR/AcrR family transcriptional regulator, mexJK operon transcriptional repressor
MELRSSPNGRSRATGGRERQGRVPDPAKHADILAAAEDLFLALGFRATSMDLVAQRAGVSKMTVYAHFPSKQALFAAIIDDLARQLARAIEAPALKGMAPEAALRLVGRQYLALVVKPSSLALHRLVVAEAARTPGLGPLIYACGPAQVVRTLAEYLARQKSLEIADPQLAAEQFLGAVLGHVQLRRLLAVGAAQQGRAAIDRIVDHAVHVFCRGIERDKVRSPPRRRGR